MISESDMQLSTEKLCEEDMQSPQDMYYPTESDWLELTVALTAMGKMQAEQIFLLERLDAKPSTWATWDQGVELLGELKAIRRLLEQAGEKKERRFSLPKLRLPRPSPALLIVPAVLLVALVFWHSLTTLLSSLGILL